MIIRSKGDLIDIDAEALVNTVNCEGFMGKGIALQFKKTFPANFKAYEQTSRAGNIQPGKMFVYATGFMMNPKYIINFPTKRGWREKSRIEYIESGLNDLINEVRRLGITSIAVPPLGCGLGGLDWHNVKPMIEHAFVKLPEVKIFLFEPAGRPEVKTMVVHNSWLGRA